MTTPSQILETKAKRKAYRETNKERITALDKKWREDNRDLKNSRNREYYYENKKLISDKMKVYYKETYKQKLAELRLRLIQGYGSKCNCCGESMIEFLDLDHVNNDGHIDRKQFSWTAMYKKVIAENFPPQYQILCSNCNQGKRRNNGICPHKKACNDHPETEYGQAAGSALPA